MANCPYCGKELGEDERYCTHCENDLSKWTDKAQKSKCFIATAAYGSPFASEVQILRDFRDKRLKNNFFGLSFVWCYYKVSPPIAKIIEKNGFLKKIVRTSLRPVVKLTRKLLNQ